MNHFPVKETLDTPLETLWLFYGRFSPESDEEKTDLSGRRKDGLKGTESKDVNTVANENNPMRKECRSKERIDDYARNCLYSRGEFHKSSSRRRRNRWCLVKCLAKKYGCILRGKMRSCDFDLIFGTDFFNIDLGIPKKYCAE